MHLDDFKTVEDIMSIALQIPYESTIKVHWTKRNRNLTFHHYEETDYTYNINKLVVVMRTPQFVYICPIVEEWVAILEESSFIKKNLRVPFSNGEYPLDYRGDYWSYLKNQIWKLRGEQHLVADKEKEL